MVKWSDFSEIQDNYKRYSAAMTFCQKVREYLLEQGQPLAFETVFSTHEKLEYLTNAKDLGYTTNVIFVSTENPQINIDRVAVRVSSGGHDVATDAVIKRYYKVMGYLPNIFALTDTLTVYDIENRIFIDHYRLKNGSFGLMNDIKK